MANPTTNYGFVLPTPTDLVTDLPADFDVALQGVDTRLKALQPGTTLGDIAYSSATANTNTRLAIGSTGNILTVAGGVPTWSAPASSGGLTLISETVASAVSSVTLGSIPQTYKQLYLIWNGIQHSTAGNFFGIRFNNDSGTNYPHMGWGEVNNSGTTQAIENATEVGDVPNGRTPFGYSSDSSNISSQAQGYLIIDNYASSTKYKFWNTLFSYKESTTTTYSFNYQGTYKSTTAISSIDIFRALGAGTFSNSTNTSIRLYGIS